MRLTDIQFRWKDDGVEETATVCILNDPEVYNNLMDNDAFDERVFFYFQDEDEFQRAFLSADALGNDEFEFVILADLDAKANK